MFDRLNYKKKRLAYLLLIIVIVLIFLPLPLSFFQQDEWHSFGLIQSYGLRYITMDKPLWVSLLADRLGARFIMYILFNVFNTNPVPYGVFALTIHFINSLLLYLFTFRVTKIKLIAFVSSIFFLVNSVSDQAYSWFGTMTGTPTSVTFILLSLIFYFNFILKRKFLYKLLSVLFLWISFLFKELGYFLLLAYPLLWLLYAQNKSLKIFLKDNFFIIAYGVIMTVFFAQSVLFISGDRANYIAPQTSGFIKLLQHFVSYPLEGISQVIMPTSLIIGIAWVFTRIFKPSLLPETSSFDQFYTTTMTEYVSTIFSIGLLILFTVIYKKYIKQAATNVGKLFVSSLLFLVLSFLPYVVIDKFDAYLDSRYYYSTLIGSSILFGITFYSILYNYANSLTKRIFVILCITILLIYHGFSLSSNLFKQFVISTERISIISQIKDIEFNLPNKAVFYVTGDSPGYYGIPELKVPFQSGLGQVLLTIYASKNPVYPLLFKEKTINNTADVGFLYDTLAQGYREINGVGFGYYYDEKELEAALKKRLFGKSSVIPLFYFSEEKKVKRINFN